ncbi:Deoxyribose-phosphate aldolase [Ignavibacterium album JCM 16511]|uniref:Deoxyribose-phosphate aldolase n=2 Tax=Ignavibacterium album TaxID=591197 RepID=I0AKK7_IGNAJ|nr:deoxyribose-phosphate aldolase [Ignavibacterium album]AFH49514.1 Deoxyribose-phosphate aldolase [Ignavibacterium album JCM 16511]
MNNVSELLSHNIISEKLDQFKSSFNEEMNLPDLLEKEIAKMIDHTLLKPDATESEIKKLCDEAREFDFASVCVNPCWVDFCYNQLKETNVKVCTVIGFPLGANHTNTKLQEAETAIADGAEEIDMVINIGQLKSRNYDYVFNEIEKITYIAKRSLALTKVIIETCLLTDEEKFIASILSKEAQADFVKTSTGFSKGGATIYDVALMNFAIEGKLKVKASGGVRSKDDALKMIAAGASRIGTSSGVKIIQGEKGSSDY